jgi:hypothetical protein
MTETERIRDQLRRSMEGDAWHGPGMLETLADVTPAQAARRVLPEAHTIWEIALHVAAWYDAVARRLSGRIVELGPDEDWPVAPDPSPEAWDGAKGLLEAAHDRLQKAIAALSDGDLERPAAGKSFSVYVMLHGSVQHALYHAGQIALLKKG